MTRKPNFAKFILGIVVLALLFIGTWAFTSAPLTSAKKSAAAITTTASAVPKMASLKPLVMSPAAGDDLISSVFEVDGNIVDPDAALPDDWSSVNCGGGNADDSSFVHDGTGTSIFTQGGSKDPNDVSQWRHKNGAVPDKDDIVNAYAAKYTGIPNGDTIISFGADRFDASGDAFIGFWIFQQNVYAAADGRFRAQIGAVPAASDPLANHVVGDVLVLVNFVGGGDVGIPDVFEWTASGLVPITGSAVGATNGADIGGQTIPVTCQASWQYTPKSGPAGTIPVAGFFEGAINISAFEALRGTCFNSFLLETRSSTSVSAQLKDFSFGSLDTCASLEVSKTADDTSVCVGTETTYTYTVHNTSSSQLTVTLRDDNETPALLTDDLDVAAGCAQIGNGVYTTFNLTPDDGVAGSGTDQATYTCSRTLGAGTHTNVVTAVGTAGGGSSDTQTDTETVTVTAAPTATISPASCSLTQPASILLDATPSGGSGGYTYLWSTGSTDQDISVSSPGIYTLTVTDSNGCVSTAVSIRVGLCAGT
jgi:hypothetical protein